jgi:hypothetical protein
MLSGSVRLPCSQCCSDSLSLRERARVRVFLSLAPLSQLQENGRHMCRPYEDVPRRDSLVCLDAISSPAPA